MRNAPRAVLAEEIARQSTPDMLADIVAFHSRFSLTYGGPPRHLEGELGEFREKFLDEELIEYRSARGALEALLRIKDDPTRAADHALYLEKQLDGLVDLVYVALGTAYLQGFDFAEAWRRVHAANMAKVRALRESDSKRGSTFDVVKPPGWKAPDLSDLVV